MSQSPSSSVSSQLLSTLSSTAQLHASSCTPAQGATEGTQQGDASSPQSPQIIPCSQEQEMAIGDLTVGAQKNQISVPADLDNTEAIQSKQLKNTEPRKDKDGQEPKEDSSKGKDTTAAEDAGMPPAVQEGLGMVTEEHDGAAEDPLPFPDKGQDSAAAGDGDRDGGSDDDEGVQSSDSQEEPLSKTSKGKQPAKASANPVTVRAIKVKIPGSKKTKAEKPTSSSAYVGWEELRSSLMQAELGYFTVQFRPHQHEAGSFVLDAAKGGPTVTRNSVNPRPVDSKHVSRLMRSMRAQFKGTDTENAISIAIPQEILLNPQPLNALTSLGFDSVPRNEQGLYPSPLWSQEAVVDLRSCLMNGSHRLNAMQRLILEDLLRLEALDGKQKKGKAKLIDDDQEERQEIKARIRLRSTWTVRLYDLRVLEQSPQRHQLMFCLTQNEDTVYMRDSQECQIYMFSRLAAVSSPEQLEVMQSSLSSSTTGRLLKYPELTAILRDLTQFPHFIHQPKVLPAKVWDQMQSVTGDIMVTLLKTLIKQLKWLVTPSDIEDCDEWLKDNQDLHSDDPELYALTFYKAQMEVWKAGMASKEEIDYNLLTGAVFEGLDSAFKETLELKIDCFFSPSKTGREGPCNVWQEAMGRYWTRVEAVLESVLSKEEDEDGRALLPGIRNRLHWLSQGVGRSKTTLWFDTVYPLLSPAFIISLTKLLEKVEPALAEVATLFEPLAPFGSQQRTQHRGWTSVWGAVKSYLNWHIVETDEERKQRMVRRMWCLILKGVLTEQGTALTSMTHHMLRWHELKPNQRVFATLGRGLGAWFRGHHNELSKEVLEKLEKVLNKFNVAAKSASKGKDKAEEMVLPQAVTAAILSACEHAVEVPEDRSNAAKSKDLRVLISFMQVNSMKPEGLSVNRFLARGLQYTTAPDARGAMSKSTQGMTMCRFMIQAALLAELTAKKVWSTGHAWVLRCELHHSIMEASEEWNVTWRHGGFDYWDGLGCRLQDLPRMQGLKGHRASAITCILKGKDQLTEEQRKLLVVFTDGQHQNLKLDSAVVESKHMISAGLPASMAKALKGVVKAVTQPYVGTIPVPWEDVPHDDDDEEEEEEEEDESDVDGHGPVYQVAPAVADCLRMLKRAMVQTVVQNQMKLGQPDKEIDLTIEHKAIKEAMKEWGMNSDDWDTASKGSMEKFCSPQTEEQLLQERSVQITAPQPKPRSAGPPAQFKEDAALAQLWEKAMGGTTAMSSATLKRKLEDPGLFRMNDEGDDDGHTGNDQDTNGTRTVAERPEVKKPRSAKRKQKMVGDGPSKSVVSEDSMAEANMATRALVGRLREQMAAGGDFNPTDPVVEEAGPSPKRRKRGDPEVEEEEETPQAGPSTSRRNVAAGGKKKVTKGKASTAAQKQKSATTLGGHKSAPPKPHQTTTRRQGKRRNEEEGQEEETGDEVAPKKVKLTLPKSKQGNTLVPSSSAESSDQDRRSPGSSSEEEPSKELAIRNSDSEEVASSNVTRSGAVEAILLVGMRHPFKAFIQMVAHKFKEAKSLTPLSPLWLNALSTTDRHIFAGAPGVLWVAGAISSHKQTQIHVMGIYTHLATVPVSLIATTTIHIIAFTMPKDITRSNDRNSPPRFNDYRKGKGKKNAGSTGAFTAGGLQLATLQGIAHKGHSLK
ncbi:hypothetical protein DAEQUDRAFT_742036 [Daedalea quercina L-15889]|uniref:Uncharacterized protein n=1 Tax=Daedalea quercina L-15889 TaxID=1314783 RepID=A0A165KJR2_9APHY|nr:hypothetical protein DAEQUDRAFT_742036 [Daedalea quercina L-15889]